MAVCVFQENGFILFTPETNKMKITINLKKLKPGLHGFHVHRYGDLREGCKSLCEHFNPYGTNHGNITDDKDNRHIGDLGNIVVNEKGICNMVIYDKYIKLKGKCSIVGRSIVIHDKPDDLGIGGLDKQGNIVDMKIHKESLKTGNAGKRILCGVIGLCNID